jgi:hypothetical protein
MTWPDIGVYCVFFLVVGVAFYYPSKLVLWWVRRRVAVSWPPVSGTIQSGEAQGSQENCIVRLNYSYCVNGKYYAGCYEHLTTNPDEAWWEINRLKGRNIIVRYKPEKPEISAVRRDDNSDAGL